MATAAAVILSAQTPADFAPAVNYTTPGAAYWSVAGDFNGDGRMDLAASDSASLGVSYALGNAAGGFDAPAVRVVGLLVQAMQTADFNRDGRTDLLIVTPAGVAVMLGSPAGFASPVYASLPVTPNFATAGDFNGDGNPDIVVAGTEGYSVALGNGTGAFQIGTLLAQITPASWAVVGDFNNDGKLDFTGPSSAVGVTYLGNGNGTFQAPVSTGPIMYGTVAAHFDGDGILDLVMLTAQPRQDGSNYAVTIARGLGNGQFVTYSNYVLGVPMNGLVAGDFNADGKTDVATRVSSTGKLRVFAGNGSLSIGGDLIDSPVLSNGTLLTADTDGNGSKDLVWGSFQQFTVFRNTHGNPPLLAQVKLAPGSVIGGSANSTGTVTLGGIAAAEGAVVTLTSSNPSAASFPAGSTVTIPAGASSATFSVATQAVASATAVDVSASSAGVTFTAPLNVVAPYSLTGLAVNPASQYGIFTVTGAITLSGPADSAAVVTLASANSALASAPASVTVPAGATSATFPITLSPVTVDTPVALTASMGGVSRTATVTVLRPLDTVAISKAIFTVKNADLRVEATSSNTATTITVYNAANGALLGTLSNAGGGKYNGNMFAPVNLTNIALKSALGGTTAGAVQIK
ncbi:MAG: VCBS repeat-containing protein [Bryobacteraceae bacterium]